MLCIYDTLYRLGLWSIFVLNSWLLAYQMTGEKKRGKRTPRLRRNYELAPGVMRFSRARMYSKRAIYAKKPFPVSKKTKEVKEKFVTKKIGGEKNGEVRKVRIKKGVSCKLRILLVRLYELLSITTRLFLLLQLEEKNVLNSF